LLSDVIEHARADVAKISDPKAQALFETAAEVLIGLRKAIEDFEQRGEAAWKQPGWRVRTRQFLNHKFSIHSQQIAPEAGHRCQRHERGAASEIRCSRCLTPDAAMQRRTTDAASSLL